jgi:A/G-specific adenine glycosylase
MPQNQLHSNLLAWFNRHARDLPWRSTIDPYKVWLSEIILQQTRVNQGTPFYHAFVKTYPTVFDLASATEGEILKIWQGLGYYSRARNMHKTAKIVAQDLNGQFPKYSKELKKLPGIGPYTSAAIASFCFNETVAVLDGNVFRVLSRMFGINTPINSSSGQKAFSQTAQDFLNHIEPGNHNQAMMELGSLVCTPTKPDCNHCPLSDECSALRDNEIESLPVKIGSKKRRIRYFHYLVYQPDVDTIFIKKRVDKDIWQHLFELPMVESSEEISTFEKIEPLFGKILYNGIKTPYFVSSKRQSQILSHQLIKATFWHIVQGDVQPGDNCNIFEVQLKEIEHVYAVPVLIKNYLSKLNSNGNVD